MRLYLRTPHTSTTTDCIECSESFNHLNIVILFLYRPTTYAIMIVRHRIDGIARKKNASQSGTYRIFHSALTHSSLRHYSSSDPSPPKCCSSRRSWYLFWTQILLCRLSQKRNHSKRNCRLNNKRGYGDSNDEGYGSNCDKDRESTPYVAEAHTYRGIIFHNVRWIY